MKGLSYTTKFRKDLKREIRADAAVEMILREVISALIQGKALDQKLKDHALAGEWKDHRDCHLKPDLVLIYKSGEAEVTLVRLGSHSELF